MEVGVKLDAEALGLRLCCVYLEPASRFCDGGVDSTWAFDLWREEFGILSGLGTALIPFAVGPGPTLIRRDESCSRFRTASVSIPEVVEEVD
jgi:hypothetical protein